MNRRSVLRGLAVAVASCTSGDWREVPTPGEDAPPVGDGRADYPHEIRVENASDRSVTVTLVVDRGGSTIYERTVTVGARSSRVVAGFTRASFHPDRRYVTIRATTDADRTASAGVSVSRRLGSVAILISDAGRVSVTYSYE